MNSKNELNAGPWSFSVEGPLTLSGRIFSGGEALYISGNVKNNGTQVGTAYVRILVSDCNDHTQIVFDSNADLPGHENQSLRLVDIPIMETKSFVCRYEIPFFATNKYFDWCVEIWNPHLLTNGPHPYCFCRTDWFGGFQVLSKGSKCLKVFVSYSWDSKEHKDWVRELVEELLKYDIECVFDQRDIRAGDQLPSVLEQWAEQSGAVVLICTEKYTQRANARRRGVGFETDMFSGKRLYSSRTARRKFIPVIRDNKRRKLPAYLGQTKYVDMSDANWRAYPMQELVAAIRNCFASKRRVDRS